MKLVPKILLLLFFKTTLPMQHFQNTAQFLEPNKTNLLGSSPTRPYHIDDLTENLSPTTSREQVAACKKEAPLCELTSSNLDRWISEDSEKLIEEYKLLPSSIKELNKYLNTIQKEIRILKEAYNAKDLKKEILYLETDQVVAYNALASLHAFPSNDSAQTFKDLVTQLKKKLHRKLNKIIFAEKLAQFKIKNN